mgnify:CR=1 FL=1
MKTQSPTPDLSNETELWTHGYRLVAGLDEVGRGAWAGPVFAAAVILPPDFPALAQVLCGVRDSKLLPPQERNELAGVIRDIALAVAIGQACHTEVDRCGIVAATQTAMCTALAQIGCCADYLLIDAMRLPQVRIPQRPLIKGDMTCLSIAAASIIAKVARDTYCLEMEREYPGYGFACHKGYGTAEHRAALERLGPCAVHRLSYEPVRRVCDARGASSCKGVEHT